MLFVLPIIFSLIFGGIGIGNGSADEQKINVAVVVNECELCEAVYTYLERNQSYNWQRYSLEDAKVAVSNQEVIAALIISENIYYRLDNSRAVFDIIVNNKSEQYLPFSNYIDGVANQLHKSIMTLKISNEADALLEIVLYINSIDPIIIEKEQYQVENSNKPKQSTTMSVGFCVMFMMFAIANSASNIHQERKEYSWQRLLISGTSPLLISLGTMLAFFIIGWIQFSIVILFMTFVYDAFWGNIGYLIMFGSLMIMTVVSFSMLLVTVVNSKVKADTLSAIIVVSTCMLGGVYWPISIAPKFMQVIGAFTPQYWMMKGLGYGLIEDTRLSVIWLPIVILLVLIIAFTTIVIKLLTHEKKLA